MESRKTAVSPQTVDAQRTDRPKISRACPEACRRARGPTSADLLQVPQPRDVSHRQRPGKVIAFTGRTLSTDEKAGPKYLNSPETAIYSKTRVLFNLDNAKEAIRKLDYAILVEGQMDCISVYAAGFHNVIASSGTAFTELQAKLLGRFSKKVVVNFDPDTAGAKATERTLGLLVEEEFQDQGADAGEGVRSRSLHPAQRKRCLRRGAEAFAKIFRLSDRPGTEHFSSAQRGEQSQRR